MRIVVVGTGTEIGKTHLGCAVLTRWRAEGVEVRGLKPIESGYDPEHSDATKLARASGRSVERPRYALADPVSPHLAARREGVRIEAGEARRWVEERPAAVQWVETAGGLYSPFDEGGGTNFELAEVLAPDRVVLVAADRLGVLHDVTAVARCVGPAFERWLVVLMAVAAGDASQGSNAQELARVGVAQAIEVERGSVEALARSAAIGRLCGALVAGGPGTAPTTGR